MLVAGVVVADELVAVRVAELAAAAAAAVFVVGIAVAAVDVRVDVVVVHFVLCERRKLGLKTRSHLITFWLVKS